MSAVVAAAAGKFGNFGAAVFALKRFVDDGKVHIRSIAPRHTYGQSLSSSFGKTSFHVHRVFGGFGAFVLAFFVL